MAEAESIKGEGLERGLTLLSQAKELGMVIYNIQPSSKPEMYELLNQENEWEKSEIITFEGMDRLTALQKDVKSLRIVFNEKKDTLRAVRTFASERAGYTSENERQKDRLEAIGLFNTCNEDVDNCPFCKSHLAEPIKGLSTLKASFEKLGANLQFIESKKPILNKYIQNLELEIDDYQLQITQSLSSLARASRMTTALSLFVALSALHAAIGLSILLNCFIGFNFTLTSLTGAYLCCCRHDSSLL